ncbi:MAG: tyrosine-protein phosphatase [Clostridia bacterium]|nr:tyrosine-protein phosphatase [Clostridia bacterium]
MKKSKFFAIIVIALTTFFTSICSGCNFQSKSDKNAFFTAVKISQTNGSETATPSIASTPSEKVEISLLSGDIYEVCKNYKFYITDDYNLENKDVFAPTPLKITWSSKETPLYYILDVSSNEDMSNSKSYVTFDTSLTLENLFMGYDYYYQIQAKFDDRIVKSKIFKFSTSYLPRTVYVCDDVSNTRDWGGYICKNGVQRVKQGIVYRGGKLENITQKGKDVMLNALEIKTDLDVRATELQERLFLHLETR